MRRFLCVVTVLVLCLTVITSVVFAAEPSSPTIEPQLVQVTQKASRRALTLLGQLFLPDEKSEYKHIGIVIMHPNSNFFDHEMSMPMAERGFTVLVSNTRYTDHGEDLFWDDLALDMKSAVEYIKAVPGIEKVILIGHSGGGPLAAFYQNIAENGAKAGQGEGKISPLGDGFDGLPKTDGLILLDAHLGYGFASLMDKDPAVITENGGIPGEINENFNMYLAENGFSPQGSNYDGEWKKNFYRAQGERNQRLLNYALGRLSEIEKGNGVFTENEPIIIPRNYARLFLSDLTGLSRTKGAYPLLTVNGIREEVIRSMRSAGINNMGQAVGEAENMSFADSLVTNVRSYLSTYGIRVDGYQITEDDIIGVDFSSTNTGAPANLSGVHVPVLIMGMTAHYWVVPSEINYNHTAASDKTLAFVDGATHSLRPSKPEYGDTIGMIADYCRDWLAERFK